MSGHALTPEAHAHAKAVTDELSLFLARPEAEKLRQLAKRLEELQAELNQAAFAFSEELNGNPDLEQGAKIMKRLENILVQSTQDALSSVADDLSRTLENDAKIVDL